MKKDSGMKISMNADIFNEVVFYEKNFFNHT